MTQKIRYNKSRNQGFQLFNDFISLPINESDKREVAIHFISRTVENDIYRNLKRGLLVPLSKSFFRVKNERESDYT